MFLSELIRQAQAIFAEEGDKPVTIGIGGVEVEIDEIDVCLPDEVDGLPERVVIGGTDPDAS